jgi:ArsR family transcriptional regulator
MKYSYTLENLNCAHCAQKIETKIAETLGMEQSTISHQLRILRDNKLARARRDGKQIYYSLDDDHVKKIIEMGLDHVLE